jgi:hypothetical protein
MSLSWSRIVGPKNVTSCSHGCYTRDGSGPVRKLIYRVIRKERSMFYAGDRRGHCKKSPYEHMTNCE